MHKSTKCNKCTIQRRFVTLIEMMIVMFLIAMIAGALAYNFQGSLDEGKAFKTKSGIEKLETVLNLEISKHPGNESQIISNWKTVVAASPIVKDPQSLVQDGWGQDYDVTFDPNHGVIASSKKYDEYLRTHNTQSK